MYNNHDITVVQQVNARAGYTTTQAEIVHGSINERSRFSGRLGNKRGTCKHVRQEFLWALA